MRNTPNQSAAAPCLSPDDLPLVARFNAVLLAAKVKAITALASLMGNEWPDKSVYFAKYNITRQCAAVTLRTQFLQLPPAPSAPPHLSPPSPSPDAPPSPPPPTPTSPPTPPPSSPHAPSHSPLDQTGPAHPAPSSPQPRSEAKAAAAELLARSHAAGPLITLQHHREERRRAMHSAATRSVSDAQTTTVARVLNSNPSGQLLKSATKYSRSIIHRTPPKATSSTSSSHGAEMVTSRHSAERRAHRPNAASPVRTARVPPHSLHTAAAPAG